MASRPTIKDVADEAGLSVATVDRVLNGRMRVREETARRVYNAAQSIGYHASHLIRQRIDSNLPSMTLGFVLQKEKQTFYQELARALHTACETCRDARIVPLVEFVGEQTPHEVSEALERVARRADAIAATSLDHHAVTAKVTELRDRGKPVFALLSDFAQGVRESYVGTNNMKVGRTAAWLLSRTAKSQGKIALFVGSFRWHGHDLREAGFRSFFREHAPGFRLLDTLANLETRAVTEEMVRGLIRNNNDLAGIYIAGGGMEGAIDALRDMPETDIPAVIVNELTPESIAALQDHLLVGAIATPIAALSAAVVDMMVATLLNGPSETPGQHFLPFELHVPESV